MGENGSTPIDWQRINHKTPDKITAWTAEIEAAGYSLHDVRSMWIEKDRVAALEVFRRDEDGRVLFTGMGITTDIVELV